jgi:hypothetical protein
VTKVLFGLVTVFILDVFRPDAAHLPGCHSPGRQHAAVSGASSTGRLRVGPVSVVGLFGRFRGGAH